MANSVDSWSFKELQTLDKSFLDRLKRDINSLFIAYSLYYSLFKKIDFFFSFVWISWFLTELFLRCVVKCFVRWVTSCSFYWRSSRRAMLFWFRWNRRSGFYLIFFHTCQRDQLLQVSSIMNTSSVHLRFSIWRDISNDPILTLSSLDKFINASCMVCSGVQKSNLRIGLFSFGKLSERKYARSCCLISWIWHIDVHKCVMFYCVPMMIRLYILFFYLSWRRRSHALFNQHLSFWRF